MESLIVTAAFAGGCFLVFLAFKWLDPRLVLGTGFLFAAYMGLDDLMTVLPRLLPALRLPGDWNWAGKLLSLAFAFGVIAALRIDRKAVGLTFAQTRLRSSLLATLLLVSLSFSLGFIFDPGVPDAETFAFQLLMPGLAEEIAYRGVAPALLLGLIHRKPAVGDVPWAVVMITGIAFGMWHGIGYSDGGLSFDTMSAVFPLVGGIAYGWLRFHSGSLLLPVLAHGLGNVAFCLPGMI
jgi:membrane protease YdiL (CAAX protease family)